MSGDNDSVGSETGRFPFITDYLHVNTFGENSQQVCINSLH